MPKRKSATVSRQITREEESVPDKAVPETVTAILDADTLAAALQKLVGATEAPQYERLPSGRIKPGTIINPGSPSQTKVPWTMRDMREVYGQVTFTPRSSVPVVVNGVRFQLVQDEEITVPAIVKDTYEEHLLRGRRGEQAKRGYFQTVGVGPVPEDIEA